MPAWKRWLPIILGLLLLFLVPVVSYGQPGSVTLVWTAPGDDANIGTATAYQMMRSPSPITAQNWSQGTPVNGLPAPQAAGTRQSVTVSGLTQGTTYYFAIRTVDDAGNWSGLSNVLRWDWVYDTAPPGAPRGLAAARESANLRLSWTANSEPDLAGYIVYRAVQPGPLSRVSGALLPSSQFLDTTIPPGTSTVWYQVSAVDESGNESARSTTYMFSMTGAAATWLLETGYPNPSPSSMPVTIPVTIPATGGVSAAIDILDAGGHLVRRFELASLPPGNQTIVWDGLNSAGRLVAPGVYRARLLAGEERQYVRLVRTP
jgi:hypothetical protein